MGGKGEQASKGLSEGNFLSGGVFGKREGKCSVRNSSVLNDSQGSDEKRHEGQLYLSM